MLVESSVVVAAEAACVWRAVTDWPRHSGWVPLTRVRRLPGPVEGLGARFVGRTGLGPFGFDDPMEVVGWQPPADGVAGRCEVRKGGRVVRGRAWFDVEPAGPVRTRLTWAEDVALGPAAFSAAFAWALAPLSRRGLRSVLRAAAADIAVTCGDAPAGAR